MESFSGRSQRPVPQRSAGEPTPQPVHQPMSPRDGGTSRPGPRKKSLWIRLLIPLVGLLILAGLLYGIWATVLSPANRLIDGGKYQAVFLTNGQVYFGKLKTAGGDFYTLTDIYYLQASTAAVDAENPQNTSSNGSDVKIIKLGTEIHGPEDRMVIGKEQVLFFENLTDKGKVSEAIKSYKSKE